MGLADMTSTYAVHDAVLARARTSSCLPMTRHGGRRICLRMSNSSMHWASSRPRASAALPSDGRIVPVCDTTEPAKALLTLTSWLP